jgi:hypothetical protein
MTTRLHEKRCGCGHIATERNRYYTGKFMTARDFCDEQKYFLSRHALHNRLLHGWGIVCGLSVSHHSNPDCAKRWVRVGAGVAIDCCGHELIFPKDAAFEIPFPPPPPGERPAAGLANYEGSKLLLLLRLVEEEIELAPALYNEGVCDPTRQESNRVRETCVLEVRRPDELEADCWRTFRGGVNVPCRDDCDDDVPGPSGSCLEPDCPCKGAVPLALVTFDPWNPDAGFSIDMQGRRTLATPREYLTHIVGINWPHGGDVSLSDLRKHMHGRLEIRFDRKILPAPGGAMPNPINPQLTGVSAYTFITQYGGVQRDIRHLPFSREKPPGLENDCVAAFTINPEYLESENEDNVADNIVYVTLKCNFILDCHNNPVDGDHMGGRLPSGNGKGGGVFESWFRVLQDHEHHGDHEGYEKDETADLTLPIQPEPAPAETARKKRSKP